MGKANKAENSQKKEVKVRNDRKELVDKIRGQLNKAFCAARDKEGLSENGLYEELKDIYGFEINKSTFRNVLGSYVTSYDLDSTCLLALCRYFGFDLNKLLMPDPLDGKKEKYRKYAAAEYRIVDYLETSGSRRKISADIPFVKSLENVRNKFLVLADDDYAGKYYCYTAYKDKSRDMPNEFVLSIERDAETKLMKATLTMDGTYNDEDASDSYSYHGVPVFIKAYRTVMLFMIKDDNSGEFLQMSFSYAKYNDGRGLVFRHGFLLTGEKPDEPSISTQSFLLFNKKISADKYSYILGLLNAPNHNFSVPVDEVSYLAEEDENVARFIEEFQDILNRNKKEVYMITEDNIMSDKESTMDEYDIVRALLLLKQQSRLSNIYHYRADYRYTSFGVNYMAGTKKKKGSKKRKKKD